jgi:hypothetical protein
VVSSTPGLEPVVATTGELPDTLKAQIGCPIWRQGQGGLSERLERILGLALEQAPYAMALGADSPGLSPAMLIELKEILEARDSAIGPTEDGGYYALGLNRCPEGLLADIPWSSRNTCSSTENRLGAHGLTHARGRHFYDVDHPHDLTRLTEELNAGALHAPHTHRLIKSLNLTKE